MQMIKTAIYYTVLMALALSFNIFADDQYTSQQTTTKAKGNVTITAKSVDEAMLAKDKMAKVEVNVSGTKLASGHKAMTSGAHLHYQIDNGPIIVTSEPSLSFANLTAGSHTISVTVVDAKHSPLSDPATVELTIP
jgi:hypothetical protein